jgi:hypothetical protein
MPFGCRRGFNPDLLTSKEAFNVRIPPLKGLREFREFRN